MRSNAVRLEKFGREDYAELISWVESEEALMQFAGPLLKFPLTAQQLEISLVDKKRIAFKVLENKSGLCIGHAEIFLLEDCAKICRILIGPKEKRGLGYGHEIVSILLETIFYRLNISDVMLNVFNWNFEAIKCYEKSGFTINHGKETQRQVSNKIWTALNMTLTKMNYEKCKQIN
jgi:RimJ/RimL family protein N-acetyltransferase